MKFKTPGLEDQRHRDGHSEENRLPATHGFSGTSSMVYSAGSRQEAGGCESSDESHGFPWPRIPTGGPSPKKT